MKKIKLTTYSIIVTSIILLSLFSFTAFSRAESDDDESDREDDFFIPPIQTIQQPVVPIIPAAPTPPIVPDVILPPTIISTSTQNTNATTVTTPVNITVDNRAAILTLLKDSDGDGVPDTIDLYPGEDDFAYSLIDNNKNGIADDLEILLK